MNKKQIFILIVILVILILAGIFCFYSWNKSEKNQNDINSQELLRIGVEYQGGKIAYIDSTGQHGLIAATSDQSASATWGCDGKVISAADETEIGTGRQNTLAMITAKCTNAAQTCYGVKISGYNDWYLPSKDELNQLYINRAAIGNFIKGYWSSSESYRSEDNAECQIFDVGYEGYCLKSSEKSIRCVRSF